VNAVRLPLGKGQLCLAGAIVLATVAAAVVAQLIDGQALAAGIGGALVVVYWALERVFSAAGRRGSFGHAVGIGVAGMMARLAVVLGALVAVGLVDREGFAACALTFLGLFTLYFVVSTSLLAGRPSR